MLKPFCDFYKNKKSKDGYRSNCIDCSKKYKELNKDIIKKQIEQYNKKRKNEKKIWAEKNKEKVKKSRKKWKDNNKEIVLNYSKEYNKKYYKDNKEKILKYSKERQKEYRKNNPFFRLKSNLRRRINRYLTKKSKSTEEILGITYDDFIKYLEQKFTDGMSWDKVGKEIHIDHIIPLSSAKTEEEVYNLCHYTNLQPLWSIDNLKKGKKIKQ